MSDTAITLTETRLAALEEKVRRGLASFIEVGQALLAIQDGRGYRLRKFDTFEDYCEATFGFSRRHGYRLIEAAKTAGAVKQITGEAPRNEAAARELGKVAGDPKLLQRVEDKLKRKGLSVATATAERIAEAVATVAGPKDGKTGRPEAPPAPRLPSMSDECPACDKIPEQYIHYAALPDNPGVEGWHCGACGAAVLIGVIAAKPAACPECGAAVTGDVGFCQSCGVAL